MNSRWPIRPFPRDLTALPESHIRAPPGSAFVILTHDHALDFLLAREALARAKLSKMLPMSA
jgi:xanthine dehydrogenase accessory factor